MSRRSFLMAHAAATAFCLGSFSADAQLSNYSQDFESLDRNDPNALANDGWTLFVASVDGTTAFPDFTAGPFGAPNNISAPQVTVITETTGGDPPAGNQGLVVFSDYNSTLHSDAADPRGLVLSVFQEQTISAADIGKTVNFSFLAEGNANPPSGSTVAEAFLITLDPLANFAATNNLSFDTFSVPDGAPTPGLLTLDLTDPLLEGQILQFGFRNTARDFEGSAVDYDNVNFSVVPEPSSLALIGIGAAALFRRKRG